MWNKICMEINNSLKGIGKSVFDLIQLNKINGCIISQLKIDLIIQIREFKLFVNY